MGLISSAAERFGRRRTSPTWLVPGLEAAAAAAQKAELEAAARPSAAELAEQLLREEYGQTPPAPTSYSLAILRGINLKGGVIYAGTVPAHVTRRRRAKNQVARKTRRVSRQRAE